MPLPRITCLANRSRSRAGSASALSSWAYGWSPSPDRRRGHNIPAPDVSTQPYLPFARPTLDEATITSVAEVLRSGWITSGPKLRACEAALSEYAGGRHVRCVSSATAALELALRVCG